MSEPVLTAEQLGRCDMRPVSEDEAQKLPDHIHYKWAAWTPDGRLIGSGYVTDYAMAEQCVRFAFGREEVDG